MGLIERISFAVKVFTGDIDEGSRTNFVGRDGVVMVDDSLDNAITAINSMNLALIFFSILFSFAMICLFKFLGLISIILVVCYILAVAVDTDKHSARKVIGIMCMLLPVSNIAIFSFIIKVSNYLKENDNDIMKERYESCFRYISDEAARMGL